MSQISTSNVNTVRAQSYFCLSFFRPLLFFLFAHCAGCSFTPLLFLTDFCSISRACLPAFSFVVLCEVVNLSELFCRYCSCFFTRHGPQRLARMDSVSSLEEMQFMVQAKKSASVCAHCFFLSLCFAFFWVSVCLSIPVPCPFPCVSLRLVVVQALMTWLMFVSSAAHRRVLSRLRSNFPATALNSGTFFVSILSHHLFSVA